MTPTAKLVELRLGGDLAGYLARSRTAGMSYRALASEITERTGLAVSYEAVRKWDAALNNTERATA